MSYTIDPVFGCHLATGRTDREGYAFHGKTRAHIAAWQRENGPVPEGFELDHACRRRHCCRVVHLEAVTRSVNEQRKSWKRRARITHCKHGHDLATNGMVTPEGGRVCRTCSRSDVP